MASKFLIASSVIVLVFVSAANADTIMTFSPTPADAWDLDHGYAYGWGIDVPILPEEDVTSATLTFHNIRNWDNSANTLYVELLDWHALGLTAYRDNGSSGNYFDNFAGEGTLLAIYQDLPNTPQTIEYSFNDAELAALNTYLADGRVGLGFDPDCHFYNDGISLQITTPEPGTLMLLAVGAVSMVVSRRRG